MNAGERDEPIETLAGLAFLDRRRRRMVAALVGELRRAQFAEQLARRRRALGAIGPPMSRFPLASAGQSSLVDSLDDTDTPDRRNRPAQPRG